MEWCTVYVCTYDLVQLQICSTMCDIWLDTSILGRVRTKLILNYITIMVDYQPVLGKKSTVRKSGA